MHAPAAETFAFDPALVCPVCRGELDRVRPCLWSCAACARDYGITEGFPDFVVGERFPDDRASELLEYEERANAACARNWVLPTLSRLLGAEARAPRVLSVGCGTGVDVEMLHAAGFDTTGLDCGHRCDAWPRRGCPDRFLLARGESAPFRDGYFDALVMGCVFPHVGVRDDSYIVAPDYREHRLALAREMARLLRSGGHLLVSSPNRRFPFDLFHRHDQGRRTPRPNRPKDPFLLSFEDYHDLFVVGAGCASVRPLPIAGYWGFVNMGSRASTRMLRGVLRGWFGAVSSVDVLRRSVLAPWLCVDVVR